MHGQTVLHADVHLALHERQEVADGGIRDLILLRRDPLLGEHLLEVRDIGRIRHLDGDSIGDIADAAEEHHLAGVAFERSTQGMAADALGLVDVGLRADVRGAALHDVELDGAHLAADLLGHEPLEELADAREVLVPEHVRRAGLELRELALVAAGLHALGHGHDDGLASGR